MDLLEDKWIDEPNAILRVAPDQLGQLLYPILDPDAEKLETPIVRGLPAGPGGASGQIVFTSEAAVEWNKMGKKVVLVREETSPEDIEGMRADTMKMLKELNAPLYRWPGGNFVSGYDWRDGIGDRDRRPPRKNPAWTGVEHNDFGMNEFIHFCRLLNAEPLITVNTGFGDAYSAAAQLEYSNGSTDTLMGAARARNGMPEPFNVRYWAIGNEMFGRWQLGYMSLNHYVRKHNWVVDKMREVDPDIVPIIPRNRPSEMNNDLIFDAGVPIADMVPISFTLSYTAIIITFIMLINTMVIKMILINRAIMSIICAIL